MGQATTGVRAAKAAQTRQRLLDAALELFSDTDYDAVAVSDITGSAGVAHGLLFHHFGSKRGLYVAALEETASRMSASFIPAEGGGPGDLIRAGVEHHLRYLAAHRGLALRSVLGGRGADPEAWAVFERARWQALDAAAGLLGLDRDDATLRMVGRTIVAIFDEMTVQWLDNGREPSIDRTVTWIMTAAAACLRSATILDPGLRLEHAVEALEGSATGPA